MQNFCTLFNSAYLSRGLAMYRSLERVARDFHLYIFAFDDQCADVLQRLQLKHATIISLKEFEDGDLLKAKADRTAGEYCWTCTSSTIWYCIHTYSLDHCTYVDADLLFFSDPKVLTDELGENSVLITEHRYSPEHDQSDLSGIYCVQFVTFRSTAAGLRALEWWKNACIDWCYKRFEEGKFGDQKYLDDWTTRFEGVHVLKNIGGGVAPWNNTKYSITAREGKVFVKEIATLHEEELVFYHFHDFRYGDREVFRLTAERYLLSASLISTVYRQYLATLRASETEIKRIAPIVTFHEPLLRLDWITTNLGRKLTFLLKGYYKNYYKKKLLL